MLQLQAIFDVEAWMKGTQHGFQNDTQKLFEMFHINVFCESSKQLNYV